ncbi:hypothetical protein SD074_09910 [Prolixibacter sp. SD074]|jgi:hypothetical protein|nr:hypothetical protein SD074_09910 [Prolixibacter sp. SD074]
MNTNNNSSSENFTTKIDEFTESKNVTQNVPLPLFQKDFSYVISYLNKIDDKVYCYFAFSENSTDILCLNSESKAMIKLDNGDVLTLNYLGDIECDKAVKFLTILTDDCVNQLSKHEINKIRFYTTKGYLDFELYDLVPKNYINKRTCKPFIGKNPKLVFMELTEEISKL